MAELEAEILSLKEHTQHPATLHPSPSPERNSSFARPLNEADRQRCHQILHGFFHGKVDNPVTAGKSIYVHTVSHPLTIVDYVPGIDSAAMFHECLVVLRSIVLRSLGINKADTSQSLPVLADPTPTQNENKSPSSSESHPQNVSPRNNKSQFLMSAPSPNSRLSSGFGSLHEEDGSINCDSSCVQAGLIDQSRNGGPQHPQRDPNLIALEQRAHKRERKERRRHKHHRDRSHNTPLSNRDDATIALTHEKRTSSMQKQQRESNPPPPTGAWTTSPVTSPTAYQTWSNATGQNDASPPQPRVQSTENSSFNQSFKSPPDPWKLANGEMSGSPSDRSWNATTLSSGGIEVDSCEESSFSPPQAKVLSPRATKQRQKLHSKHDDLLRSREEKQRLANEVNLLNLKVQEEGTK